MAKGAQTRQSILDRALVMVQTEGLEGLSIGKLAMAVGMSKSGLFAHFASKEALQRQVLELAASQFVTHVVAPALKQPRGEPRVAALFHNWLEWGGIDARSGGCVFLAAATELDDRPGLLRNYLVQTQRDWNDTLSTAVRIARDEGHFSTNIDPGQIAFEIYGVMMSFHFYARLMGDDAARRKAKQAFTRVLESIRIVARPPLHPTNLV